MDHLPEICQHRSISIPCFAPLVDTKRSFYDFSKDSIGSAVSSAAHNQDKEAYLQNWLYFAFINDFCAALAIDIKRIELIRQEHDLALFLSTAPLHRKILDKLQALRRSKKTRRRLRDHSLTSVRKLITDADAVLFALFPKMQLPFTNGVCFETVICLSALLELFNEAFGQILEVEPVDIRVPDPQDFIKIRMLDAGWCPSAIEDFLPFDTSAAYLATQMEVPRFPRTEDHSSCSSFRCLPRNKRSDLHKPVHILECDQKCGEFEVSLNELEAVINAGSIPIIFLEQSRQKTSVKLKAKRKSKGGHRYVALSHVWSHGLGNREANALPKCQILKIFKLISKKYPNRGAWIDTLCIPYPESRAESKSVPAQSVHHQNVRSNITGKDAWTTALEDIGLVYSLADATLVLDRNLENTSESHYQRLLALTASDWMRRVWTYQELVIGFENVVISFGDDLVPIAQLLSFDAESELTKDCVVAHRILEDINGSLPFELSAPLFDDQPNKQHAISPVIKNLRRRATTESADEFLCLITLLNLDTRLLAQEPTMVTILQQLHQVPADLPFCAGDRLDVPGYRWAPSSFLEQPPATLSIDETESTSTGFQLVNEEGNVLGFMIIKDAVFLLDSFEIVLGKNSDSKFVLVIIDAQSSEPFMVVRPERHIAENSAQLRDRQICPNLHPPESSMWPREHLRYPAALLLQSGSDDPEKIYGRDEAILLSNITANESSEGGEDVYTGDYELRMSCFLPDLVPPETMQTAMHVRGVLLSKVPFVLV